METAMPFFIVCKTKTTGPQVSKIEERKKKKFITFTLLIFMITVRLCGTGSLGGRIIEM